MVFKGRTTNGQYVSKKAYISLTNFTIRQVQIILFGVLSQLEWLLSSKQTAAKPETGVETRETHTLLLGM